MTCDTSSTLTVLVFGPQARMVKGETLIVPHQGLPTTAGSILTNIGEHFPPLRPSLSRSKLAVNHEIADADTIIDGSEELALIGLVSGG
ncbi:MoaD/ThiS family protein [Stratiformator vulcanicus]|uniref:ThiS family protein n=1 Tax=Stratiformator vulcanicus TaxID=2527980 RepID=A0A517QW28_9PLAN|nr:MoaD/ThiS family protein [Stratiformator vulcanicus]QDT35869.1 ThiS family protein [Stratiformator vulcanicus]